MSDRWIQKCKDNEKDCGGYNGKCPSHLPHKVAHDKEITYERPNLEGLKLGQIFAQVQTSQTQKEEEITDQEEGVQSIPTRTTTENRRHQDGNWLVLPQRERNQ